MDLRDRAIGSVVGLALGDALGAPFEGRRKTQIPSPLPAFELQWKGLPPGMWTDDTAMARNLSRSLVARRGLDVVDVLRRHLEWFATSPPDVGNLTRTVLSWARDGVADPARRYVEERGPEVSAGNGSVMYCAPLGLAYANRPDELFELAPALSALTHFDGRCRTAVLAVTLCAAALVRGEPAEHAAATALRSVEDHEGGEELEHLVEAIGGSRPIDGPDQGFCLFAAGVAFQALVRGGDAESELLRVVSLGGDADTNAAVAGALLGARDGATGLPNGWLERLIEGEAIRSEAETLVPSATIGRDPPGARAKDPAGT